MSIEDRIVDRIYKLYELKQRLKNRVEIGAMKEKDRKVLIVDVNSRLSELLGIALEYNLKVVTEEVCYNTKSELKGKEI